MTDTVPVPPSRLEPRAVPASAVIRSDLIERLDALDGHRFALITAPAGFGKTWLVSEWLAHRMDYERCWVTVDTDANDPVRLLTHLAESIGGSYPDASQMLAAQIADASIGVSFVLDTMLAELASTGTPFVIVIDDTHLLESTSAISILRHLLRELPPNVKLIAIGRQAPPVPLARLRMAGEVLELTTGDLRCTKAESVLLVQDSLDLDLGREVVEALHDKTGGWIAGIRLAAGAASHQDDAAAIERHLPSVADLDAATFESVGDYLAEEALDHLSEDDRQFMLDTSILENLSGPLCDAVTERSGSRRFLESLRQSGSFTTAVDYDAGSYRYHAIVRDAMRTTLHRTQPTREIEVHRRAAAWLHDHGDVVAAVRHAVLAGDAELASKWIVEASVDLLENSQIETMKYLIEYVDATADELSLSLSTIWAYAVLFTDTSGAEVDRILGQTLAMIRDLPREVADNQPWSSIPEPMHESSDELADQLDITIHGFRHGDIGHAMAIVDRRGGRPSESGWIEAAAGWLLILQEQPSRGLELVEAWTDFTFSADNPILAVEAVALAMSAAAEIARGDLLRARVTAERAASLLDSRGQAWVPQAATSAIPAGWVAWELGDLDRAEEAVLPSIDRIDFIEETPSATYAHALAARIAWSRGETQSAFAHLDEALITNSGRRVVGPFRDWLDFERARLHLLDGDVGAATMVLPDWRDRLDTDPPTMREALILGRLLASEGEDPSQVFDHLPAEVEVTQSHEIEMHKIRALAHLAVDEGDLALEQLTAAMRIASYTGHVQTFLDDASHFGGLLHNAIALSGHRLPFELRGTSAFASARSTPTLIEPLTDRELEVLALLPSHYTYQDIADELMMSHNTVKSHLGAIYRKLDANRRSEAVDAGRALGLIA